MKFKTISLKIHKLADLMNERFGLSILIITTFKLIHFVIDLYWVYIRFVYQQYDSAFIREYFLTYFFRSIKKYS